MMRSLTRLVAVVILITSSSAAPGHGRVPLSLNTRNGVETVVSPSSSTFSGRVPVSWNGGLRRGESGPLRLRGGGAGANAPKYSSNVALQSDEYHMPFGTANPQTLFPKLQPPNPQTPNPDPGTVLRSKSGIMFAPTPTPQWFEEAIMYQIYPLGTPGRTGVEEGGGFFGEVPSTNDLTAEPQQRLQATLPPTLTIRPNRPTSDIRFT